jgi:hypothetical protein
MIYKHYKTGGLYELICEAKHSETLEELVVYKNIKTGETWVRPKWMFFSVIPVGPEGEVRRFQEVKDIGA